MQPSELFLTSVPITIQEIIDSPATHALSIFKKQMGEDKGSRFIQSFMEIAIATVAEQINVAREMSSEQIKVAAGVLARNYWHLSPADIRLCFERGVLGRYGPLYGGMDVQVLSGWLDRYDQERMELSITKNLKHKEPITARAPSENELSYREILNQHIQRQHAGRDKSDL